jgi:hypothetical protein
MTWSASIIFSIMQKRDWNQEWRSGRWDFLGDAAEQPRLAAAARMIGAYGAGRLVDLGSGDGALLRHLDPGRTPHCLCVDISDAALARLARLEGIQVDLLVADLERHHPARREAAALACAEVLYYVDDPAAMLSRWAAACHGLRAVVVSIAEPGTRFPEWAAPVARTRAALGRLGWPLLESETMDQPGQRWIVAAYRPERAHG